MLLKVIKVRRKEAIAIVSEQSQVKSVHWADLGPWAGPLGESSTLEIYAGVAEGLLKLHQAVLNILRGQHTGPAHCISLTLVQTDPRSSRRKLWLHHHTGWEPSSSAFCR